MNALRIRKTIESETITMPELRPLIGRNVEFIVLEETAPPFPMLETEETFLGLAPPDPTPEQHAAEMAKLREMAKTDPKLAAWLKAIDEDAIDVEAVIRARGLQ